MSKDSEDSYDPQSSDSDEQQPEDPSNHQSKINSLFANINNHLKKKLTTSPDSAKQKEKYMVNKVKCYGNSNPEIHSVYKQILKQNTVYKSLSSEDKFKLSLKFLNSDYFDNKLICGNILNEIYKHVTNEQFTTLNNEIKNNDLINEWASSDCLASKFYKFWGLLSKENSIKIANLRNEDNLWLRRISIVAFINRIKFKDEKPNFKGFIDLIYVICECIKVHEERFNQLALGWVLRELSIIDYDRYEKWVLENYCFLSREAIRYSVEKIDEKKKKKIMCYNSVSGNEGKKYNSKKRSLSKTKNNK